MVQCFAFFAAKLHEFTSPLDWPMTPEVLFYTRRSVRSFLPALIPTCSTLERILLAAARAPSGTNTQPWKVTVLRGESLTNLTAKLLAAADDPDRTTKYGEEYPYYPKQWNSPYLERRRKIGYDMYELLGIGKRDVPKMREQWNRNFEFFGAPVGLMFTIDRVMEQGSWLDYGMFLQTLMLAARAEGLDTCPQAAFNEFHSIILPHIGANADEMLVCGMSLGFADENAVVNQLKTERAPINEFVRFLD